MTVFGYDSLQWQDEEINTGVRIEIAGSLLGTLTDLNAVLRLHGGRLPAPVADGTDLTSPYLDALQRYIATRMLEHRQFDDDEWAKRGILPGQIAMHGELFQDVAWSAATVVAHIQQGTIVDYPAPHPDLLSWSSELQTIAQFAEQVFTDITADDTTNGN